MIDRGTRDSDILFQLPPIIAAYLFAN